MTASPASPSSASLPAPDATTVELAEAAWLDAMTATGTDAMRALMHPDCVVVHAAVGHIHRAEEFLQHTANMGRITRIEAYDVTVQRFAEVAIVSCLQEMHVAYVAGLTPFAIQAAATRVWVPDEAGWKLAHMQLARRLPPG
jgi:ketosteroid isomerase-like protein